MSVIVISTVRSKLENSSLSEPIRVGVNMLRKQLTVGKIYDAIQENVHAVVTKVRA